MPLHGINWLLVIMQEVRFYCEVGIVSLNVIQVTFRPSKIKLSQINVNTVVL
jgi:hypothetical protein